MYGITSEHVNAAMTQLMAKIVQPTANIPLLGIPMSGPALFWGFAGLSVVIGAWTAGHFRILAAQTPLDGREPWHLVDPIVFPDRRLLAKPARVIEWCVGVLFEILCAVTPLLLVLLAIGVSYDDAIKEYPLLKYLNPAWGFPFTMSSNAQTVVIAVAAIIAIFQCIWVAIIIYHAIRKSFTKTVSEVE